MKGERIFSPKKRIRIPSFGTVIGLGFTHGGFAEVLMMPSEFSAVLDVWEEYERARPKPDKRVLAALEVLIRKAHGIKAAFVAEVPIAQKRAKITAAFDQDE